MALLRHDEVRTKSALSLEAAKRVGPMTGRWQNWKAKPMTRGEFIAAFAAGLIVLVLLELAIH